MKANEFVKKFGLDRAVKLCITQAPHSAAYYNITGGYERQSKRKGWQPNEYCVSISEVKRLVESHEYIESYGGLIESKRTLEIRHGVINLDGWDKLEQAIADVESCK